VAAALLHPDTFLFASALNAEIYVDKSLLIEKTNALINTERCFVCVSRPRRFGKSMGLNMLAAYYDSGSDTGDMFSDLKISECASYELHRNKYHVISVNMQDFLTGNQDVMQMIASFSAQIIREAAEVFPEVTFSEPENLINVLDDIYKETGKRFVILIDEWDCVFRVRQDDMEGQKYYLDFLRMLLKDKAYIALAYMTGILPIKKYGTHSALNMFTEYSMTSPGILAPYFGFVEDEVKELCDHYHMSIEEAKDWYDGYHLSYRDGNADAVLSMYNPKDVSEAMITGKYDTYWNNT